MKFAGLHNHAPLITLRKRYKLLVLPKQANSMKSLKEENSTVENVDVADGKGQSLNVECLVGTVVFGMHQLCVLLQEGTVTNVGR